MKIFHYLGVKTALTTFCGFLSANTASMNVG